MSQPYTNPRHTLVDALGLFERRTILQDGHGAELQDLERLAVESMTRLAKYDKARCLEFYRDRN
jgi:hypothetical protein